MKPSKILTLIEDRVGIADRPREVKRLITECIISDVPALTKDAAAELAEKHSHTVIQEVYKKISSETDSYFGYAYHITIIEAASGFYISGSCCDKSSDTLQVREDKRNRARRFLYEVLISGLTPRQFEAFCGKFISLLGVKDPIVTPSSNDQGLDFIGKWTIGEILNKSSLPIAAERQLNIWLAGQAKAYKKTKLNTSEIRELVGSIELARSKAYSSVDHAYNSLNIRACDPVFYLFMTTGDTTKGVRTLLEKSGVIFFDAQLLGLFLADRLGQIFPNGPNQTEFENWLCP